MIKGYGGYVFGDNNTNPKKLGLNNSGAVEGLTYITDWFKNVWPKGMQSKTSNENFITDQFTSGKTAAVIDGPWMAATYKKDKVNYGVATIPTLDNGKNIRHSAAARHGSFQSIRRIKQFARSSSTI